VLGAKEALARTRDLCESAAGRPSPLRRQSARAAAVLLVAGGEHELALRALANAVGRLDPADVERPQTPYYFSFSPYQFMPQPLAPGEMVKLFPEGADKEWCRAAADALSEWIADDVLEPRTATRLQALLAVRLHAAGETETAAWLAAQADARSKGDPATRVWVLDAWRALGAQEKAEAMERALLEARALPLARIPAALERLAARDTSAAEKLRADVATYTDLEKVIQSS